MTKSINVEIVNHGTFTFTAEAMDLTIMRYLPASPDKLRRLCAEMTGCEYDDVDTVTELLAVLADAEGKWLVEERSRNAAIRVEVKVNMTTLDYDNGFTPECYETTLPAYLGDNGGNFDEDEIIEMSNAKVGESFSFGDIFGNVTTITRI